MLAYPSIWARVMGAFSAQRASQNPDDNPDQTDVEDVLSRTADTVSAQEERDNRPGKGLKGTS